MSESTSDSGNLNSSLTKINTNIHKQQILNKNLIRKDEKEIKQNRNFLKFLEIPKPDFSAIIKNDSNFRFKKKGSYKKSKKNIPESPTKSIKKKSFTSSKFHSKIKINKSTCRKLDFDVIKSTFKDQINLFSINRKNNGISKLRKIIDFSDEEMEIEDQNFETLNIFNYINNNDNFCSSQTLNNSKSTKIFSEKSDKKNKNFIPNYVTNNSASIFESFEGMKTDEEKQFDKQVYFCENFLNRNFMENSFLDSNKNNQFNSNNNRSIFYNYNNNDNYNSFISNNNSLQRQLPRVKLS